MSTPALLGMILILGIVVGGFAFFLTLAIKKESKRKEK